MHAKRPLISYELLGGPLDGETRRVPEGDRDFAARIGGNWHLYSTQSTDLGMMLVYTGSTTRLRAADSASQ